MIAMCSIDVWMSPIISINEHTRVAVRSLETDVRRLLPPDRVWFSHVITTNLFESDEDWVSDDS